ncbi:hypothetical protein BDP55DRAFT_719499 [Colletotrichum godetiae]|uniref:Uncharacterized protein n=1 Tax=Colletotrichum godetiae TaxID=1209918 RepID=A0AAJ0AC64_9PEZI|nr:uncharacterized protein BDP55DRAFT_719499 [Colletotrichum godetiae]KAK1659849.1 hypothetical protein BDP55DRAFT_719499 [Colletotrichum godetiae]
MSVMEKMNLWAGIRDFDPSTPPQNDQFQGVKDVEEDETEPWETRAYHKVVLKSDAFNQRLRHLETDLSLRFNEGAPCVQKEIRRVILKNLSTRTISKKRPPKTQKAKFRLLNWPTFRDGNLLRVLQRQQRASMQAAFELKVLVYCIDESQCTAIREYMDQTWLSSWRHIFDILNFYAVNLGEPWFNESQLAS